jgi:hypothetical protein
MVATVATDVGMRCAYPNLLTSIHSIISEEVPARAPFRAVFIQKTI